MVLKNYLVFIPGIILAFIFYSLSQGFNNIIGIELLGYNKSPISKFLEKNPKGGMHHICFEVENITETINSLKNKKINILGDGNPKIGAHDKPVVFLHPNDLSGTLIELEET